MFDRDTLWNHIYFVLEKEISDPVKIDYLTDRICDAVSEWVPKQGDFWLDDEGVLRVNQGWKIVTAEAPESLNPESKWDDPIPDGVDPWNLRGRGLQ